VLINATRNGEGGMPESIASPKPARRAQPDVALAPQPMPASSGLYVAPLAGTRGEIASMNDGVAWRHASCFGGWRGSGAK